MNLKLIGILSVIFCFTGISQAQTYSSRKLAKTGELFPSACLPAADSIFSCQKIIAEKSFIVKYNSKNEIEHLGVSLFSPETKTMINEPVCNFIERLLLELLLQKSSAGVMNKLHEYKIKLQKNGVDYGKTYFTSLNSVLDDIRYPTQFTIHKDSLYTAVWEFGAAEEMSLTFPASRELIFGTDKKESDLYLGKIFEKDDCINTFYSVDSVVIPENEFLAIAGTDFYRRKGNSFMIDKINSDTYYQRTDRLYQLVFNPDYPAESLTNVFITRQIPNSLVLRITHRMYGGFTPEFTIPLNRIFCLFGDGFSSYCLLQRTDKSRIQLSVVLHNSDFNYIHLLQIKTFGGQIDIANGILTADLYTNIPLHNLKNLFQ
jgi:hypothetical protein